MIEKTIKFILLAKIISLENINSNGTPFTISCSWGSWGCLSIHDILSLIKKASALLVHVIHVYCLLNCSLHRCIYLYSITLIKRSRLAVTQERGTSFIETILRIRKINLTNARAYILSDLDVHRHAGRNYVRRNSPYSTRR